MSNIANYNNIQEEAEEVEIREDMSGEESGEDEVQDVMNTMSQQIYLLQRLLRKRKHPYSYTGRSALKKPSICWRTANAYK